MTAALFKSASAPLLNRVRGWELIALGLSGWVTLYSSAILNFQRNIADIAGHSQGLCFAVAMVLGGTEARKRHAEERRKRNLREALAWTAEIPKWTFEDQMGLRFEASGYSLEKVSEREQQLGFCLRAVRHGRTTLVYGGLWRQDTVDGEYLVRMAVGPTNAVCADRILVLTKAEMSAEVIQQMPKRWELISGAEFLALTKEFPIFSMPAQKELIETSQLTC